MSLDIALISKLSQNVLGQNLSISLIYLIRGRTDLAELNTHLIIRVDTPDSTLNVDLVLVHGNQSTKGSRV